MALTPAQLAVLKAAIAAETDPEFVGYRTASERALMQEWFNRTAVPDFWVWRTNLSKREVTSSVSPDGTTFSFPALISRSSGEQFGWGQVWNSTLECDPSQANVRQAFADIFSGGTGSAQRAHLLAMGRRVCTRAEKLFVTGNGTTSTPATMGYEGDISEGDILNALLLA